MRKTLGFDQPLTVKELIEHLAYFNPDSVVIIPSRDGDNFKADDIRIIDEVAATPGNGATDYRVSTRALDTSVPAVYIH